jgi:predicted Zn-ribbon and HTH transcriptional regulator
MPVLNDRYARALRESLKPPLFRSRESSDARLKRLSAAMLVPTGTVRGIHGTMKRQCARRAIRSRTRIRRNVRSLSVGIAVALDMRIRMRILTSMAKVKVLTLKCARCGHEWTPRKPEVVQCPECKSARWDQPKTEDARTNR